MNNVVKTSFIFIALILFTTVAVYPQDFSIPKFNFIEKANSPEEVSTTLELLFLFTVLSLIPSILLMMTSFTRFAIIFSFLKRALGTNETPPTQIMNGLALFLTFMVMSPVFQEINDTAITPYMESHKDDNGRVFTQRDAFAQSQIVMKKFLLQHSNRRDVRLFIDLSKIPVPEKAMDIPMTVLIPAFMVGELTEAFKIGFLLFLPFFVIDMVISSVLMSMGMMMLPPQLISLPFKILLFILIDGWNLLIQEMVRGFG
ncbi:MAG: flagellar biosynthetic protein FliP [Planctomycetota bacterium]|nr:MAG: flagellar biosynthetic protein FliP [Planctomycetota bacterium]